MVARTAAALSLWATLASIAGAEQAVPDRLVGLCFYDITSEVCNLPIDNARREPLDRAKITLRRQMDSDSIAAAEKRCANFKEQFRQRSADACTAELKAYFYQTLEQISGD
jgi:hypothetical protein